MAQISPPTKKKNLPVKYAAVHGQMFRIDLSVTSYYLAAVKPAPAPPKLQNGWHAVKCASLDDMRTQNILFWQRQGGAAIRKAAWELVVETWQAQHRDPNELRFQRIAAPPRGE